MEKGKIIFIGVLAIIFIGIVFITIGNFSSNKNTSQKSSFDVPDIVAEKSKDHYASKLEKANLNRKPHDETELNRKVEFKTYAADSTLNDTTDKPQTEINPEKTTSTNTAKPKNTYRNQKTQPKTRTKTTKQPVVNNTPVKVKHEPKTPKGGFGIIHNQNVADNLETETYNPIDTFFPVMLESAVTVKDNSDVVFVLLEDFTVNNITFFKNSFAFGKAKTSNHFFDLNIYQIKNTDGRMYNVKHLNLFVFDENYSRGFKFEGNLASGTKEGIADAVGSTSTSTYGGRNIATNMADRVIQSVTRKKNPTVDLLRGYRIYIKPIE